MQIASIKVIFYNLFVQIAEDDSFFSENNCKKIKRIAFVHYLTNINSKASESSGGYC